MNIETQNCQPDLIESFLKGDLDRVKELQLTDHLETCDVCRKLLESNAAEPAGWMEASRLLKPTLFDWNPDVEQDSLDCADQTNPLPLQVRNVLDSLVPSEDPEMLGQLGGYEVSGVVGAGAMGVVLKASDRSLDRTVAIKVLSPHLAASGAARKRFAREAKAAAAVLHPNVIAIHGVSNDQALPHLVMPYVRGASLQKRINDDGSLPVDEVLRIGAQVAAGLAAAHAQGLVHRDIKPANILLEEGVERVAITDFGLARAVDDASLTRAGIIAGTPQYMSPEQSRGESVDQRSDLFSLGSVMYAMCVGRPPFRSETTYGVIQRINNDQPTPIRELNPGVPEWLAQIIEKLMSKQATDRYESAQEVSDLLEQCLAHVQQPSTTPLPVSAAVGTRSSRFFFNSRFRIRGITMVATLGLSLLGLFLWQGAAPPQMAGKAEAAQELAAIDIDPTKPGRLILHYCDADGTPIRPLLKDPELRRALDRQGTPDVSADGKRVAFDAWSTTDSRWKTGQIVVCDIDGSNAHVVCDGLMPSFSPDGKQLAISRLNKYTKADGVQGNSIWIVNTDGSKKRVVAERGAWGARWSSDGKSLAFIKGVDENGKKVSAKCLRIYDLETEKTTTVFSGQDSPFKKIGFHLEWAKNKRSVAFAGIKKGQQQYVSATIDVDEGLDSLQLFDSPLVAHYLCYDYHPDGESLLVTGIDNGRPAPVSLALTDEAKTRFLPNVPANVVVRDTCYTPDGKHVIAALSGFKPINMPEKNPSDEH